MMRKFVLFCILLSQNDALAQEIPGADKLPEGEGRGLIIANCSPCHSLNLVTQNYMSRQTWDETITWMQRKQNLWPLPKETRSGILDYLEKNFGVRKKRGLGSRPATNSLPE